MINTEVDTSSTSATVAIRAVPPPAQTLSQRIDCMLAYQVDAPSEFVFLVHAANGMDQVLVQEALRLEPATPFRTYSDIRSGNRFLRLQAQPGPLRLQYQAEVDRIVVSVDRSAREAAVADIPDDILHFLMPTRYCESDHLGPAAIGLFGALAPGYARVQAIVDWVRNNIEYRVGSSTATTTARDVYAQRLGVCRDFAHLAVTFCRALNIPARMVSGYCGFVEPPPDFHAIFEAYLGRRWVQFDPSGMAPPERLIRLASGRDAKDVAFATIFGPARMVAMSPQVTLLDKAAAPTRGQPCTVW